MEEKIERAIKKLKKQRFLNKYRVINELFKESNNNSGILETSCVLTLKCPVSRIRIKTPIRFHQCKHAQCFDADSFFQLTLSSIIKKCPICNLQSSYNSLVVDGLFYEILKNTSDLDEHVILYSNGNWEVKKENNDEFKLHQKQNIGNSYYIDTNKIYNYSHKNQNFENHNTIYSNIMGSNNNTGNYIRNNHNHNHNHNNNNNKNINNNINNRKNVIYNCRIIDHNNYHCDDDQLSTSSPISRSISTISSNNDNYIEKTKKRLLEDLNCLKYGLQKTTLHNEVINNIDEQENDEIENKYYETNFDNNNKVYFKH
ncbi:hypothetical protein BCR32DRAFT_251757 [Anaeromyces robustus]|uniref:SP-RING-type domain-containing protein n=1 Tax=Anaeromyces robustus TaxID=1754192 RepID=A0A1Y1VKP7_9FUNG|nr:hypothetical protein BCR32DRAFT_251757 [Anaeromyces robustus]|eukprot:ORX59050.1 hypothetical protein BCR32DRAFT_251757 [Anaeromyces robustus]